MADKTGKGSKPIQSAPLPDAQAQSIQQALNQAVEYHSAGQLPEAEKLYRQVLQGDPDHPVALHLLGMIANQVGQNEAALELVKKALLFSPEYAEAHNTLGNALQDLGQLEEAVTSYQQAIRIKPDYSDAHSNLALSYQDLGRLEAAIASFENALAIDPHNPKTQNNLGTALQQSGRLDDALACYRKSIEINPEYAAGHNNLGNVLLEQGKLDEAIASFNNAVAINPDFADGHNNLGTALQAQGKMEDARACYRRSIEINPDHIEGHNNLGNVSKELGALEDAVACYRKAIDINPDYFEGYSNLGNVLRDLGRFDEAITNCRQALSLQPDFAEAHNNLGNALQGNGAYEDAMASYRQAIALMPDFAEAYSNLGNALKDQGQLEEALGNYKRVLEIDPENAKAHFNLGILQLLSGNFEEGWPNYDWRWRVKDFVSHESNIIHKESLWHGENLKGPDGKKILVSMEQGIGDEIMFASMIPDLAQVADEIVVECEARLVPLFKRSFPTITFIVRSDAPLDDATEDEIDFQIPAGNLGSHFRRNFDQFPKPASYLLPDAKKKGHIRNDYSDRWPDKRLVGISWKSGNVSVGGKRSLMLDQWEPLLANPDCQFINLQYGNVAGDLADLKKSTGVDVYQDPSVDPLKDMDAFAAQVAALDLVISVTNTTVHVAGALGIPTWIMLQNVPDWRWVRGRDDSLWYPSIRLFRQENPDNWEGVIARVNEELSQSSDD
jgi:tetratricopeptide (TPR) repeat protein